MVVVAVMILGSSNVCLYPTGSTTISKVTTTTVVLRGKEGLDDSANYMAANASSVIQLSTPQTSSSTVERATCARPSNQTLGGQNCGYKPPHPFLPFSFSQSHISLLFSLLFKTPELCLTQFYSNYLVILSD